MYAIRSYYVCFCEVMAAVEQEDTPETASPQGGAEGGYAGSEEVMSLKREWCQIKDVLLGLAGDRIDLSILPRITSYNVCYTKLL